MLPNQNIIQRAPPSQLQQHPQRATGNRAHTSSVTMGAPQNGIFRAGVQPVYYNYPPTDMAAGSSASHTREQDNSPPSVPSQSVASYGSTLDLAMVMQTPRMQLPHVEADGVNGPHSSVATSSTAKGQAGKVSQKKKSTNEQAQQQHSRKGQKERGVPQQQQEQKQIQQQVQLNIEQQLHQQAHQQQHYYHHQQNQLQQLEQARLYMRSQSSQPAQDSQQHPHQQQVRNAQSHHLQNLPNQSPQQHTQQQELLHSFQLQLLQLFSWQQEELRRRCQPPPQPYPTQNPLPTLPQGRQTEKISEIATPHLAPATKTPVNDDTSNAHASTRLSLSKREERCKLDSTFLHRYVADFLSLPRYVPHIVTACEGKQKQFYKERSNKDKSYTEAQAVNSMSSLRLDNTFDVGKALGGFSSAIGRLSGGMVATDSLDREASLRNRAFVQMIETVKKHDGLLQTLLEKHASSFNNQAPAPTSNDTPPGSVIHELKGKVHSQHLLLQSLSARIFQLEQKEVICSRCDTTEKNIPSDTQQTQDDQNLKTHASSNQAATDQSLQTSEGMTQAKKVERRDAGCQHEKGCASTANASVASEQKADKEVQVAVTKTSSQEREASRESSDNCDEGKTVFGGEKESQHDQLPTVDQKEHPAKGGSETPSLGNERDRADEESEVRIVINNERCTDDGEKELRIVIHTEQATDGDESDMSIVHSGQQSSDEGSEGSSPEQSFDDGSVQEGDCKITYDEYVSQLKDRVDRQLSKSKASPQKERSVSQVRRLGTPPSVQLRSPTPSPNGVKKRRKQQTANKDGVIDVLDSSDESSDSAGPDRKGSSQRKTPRSPVTRRIPLPDDGDSDLKPNSALRESLNQRKRSTTRTPGSDEEEPMRSKRKTNEWPGNNHNYPWSCDA